MSRFPSLRDRDDSASDPESEREALRRQRAEAAQELASLKGALSERVANVQARERELEQALGRVQKREAALEGGSARGARVEAVRARLAEAKAARVTRGDEKERAELAALGAQLEARAQELAERERALDKPAAPVTADAQSNPREAELAALEISLAARATELDERAAQLDAREQELLAAPEPEPEPEPEPSAAAEELALLETKIAELRDAERAFARTHAELAARSDALTEREAELAVTARELAAQEARPADELEALEARIRRLEQGPRSRGATTQTFSGGLRALQERGLRQPPPDEKLH